MLVKKENALNGKRIGIMGKGGSGKSTVTALLAKSLKKSGYEVCVLDADPTNIGLAQALGIERPPAPLLDYFGDLVSSDGSFTYPTNDPTPLIGADIQIEDLPEAYHGRSPDGIQLFIAGKIADIGIGADFIGPIATKIAHDFNPGHPVEAPVTLVDFKAGLESLVSGDALSLDWIVVVIDPTLGAVKMAIQMQEIVNRLKVGKVPFATYLDGYERRQWRNPNQIIQDTQVPRVSFVLNKIQHDLMENFLQVRLTEKGFEPIGVIHDALAVAMAGLMGERLINTPAQVEADWIVKALETAVTPPPIPSPPAHSIKYDNPLNRVPVEQYSLS